jgi:two-component system chemotaxis response regulator CheB
MILTQAFFTRTSVAGPLAVGILLAICSVIGFVPRVEAGTVYFPKGDTHMMIDRTHRLFSSRVGSMGAHRPSVDVLFKSAAQAFGAATIGVLLSGMGRDGVLGLKDIYESGGITLAQDKLTSVVFGMPGAALDLGVVQKMLPLDQIASQLMDTINAQRGFKYLGEKR